MASIYEQYGTSNTGVDLYWTRSEPVLAPGQKVPFVIGLHPGGYKAGSAVLNNVRDKILQNGLIFCGTEYRLAPPSKEMNSASPLPPGFTAGNHVSTAQNEVNDHGYAGSPEADVAMAVRAARIDPKCDGRVYGVGGSAGASLVIYNMLTGTEGDDKFDLGVSCSIGVFDFYQSEIWFIPNPGDETYPAGALANRLNIPDTNPLPPTGADLATAKVYSPSFLFNSSKIAGRHWTLISNRDSAGIPTSSGVDIPSYQKTGGGIQVNEGTPPYTTNTGFIKVCIAAGMTESTADVPESGNFYKKTIVDVANAAQPNPLQHAHAFNYWPSAIDPTTDPLWTVGDAVATWLAAGPAGTIGERPSITSFEPSEGFAGVTAVVITGDNFNGTQGVRFNHVDALSFVVDSNTQITAIPPIGATTGVITVRTPVDTVNSTTDFVVTTQTIIDDDALEARQPILSYPRGGLAPVPPMPPAAPTAVEAHASGVAGSHSGQATWIPPTDTSGATLLNYVGYLTSETGASGTVPDIPGSASSVALSDLELDTEYAFHIAAVTAFGQSEEVTVVFTSNSSVVHETVKDQPRGCLFLFDSPINRITGKHETDYNPSGFWGNPRLYGSRYRSSWDTICTNPLDPTDDTYYDWTDIDAYIDKCELYDQFGGISFAAGIYCPPWIYDNPRIKTIDQTGPDPGVMPIPWNEAYLDKWISFIKSFGERYDDRDGLSYFVIGGLGQVVETYLAINTPDLEALYQDATDRGFGTIEEAWMFAANRILFACSKAFKHTHFLISLANIVPNSGGPTWGPGGQGELGCSDVFTAGQTIASDRFGVMNAGLNEHSDTGFVPNEIIHDHSSEVTCGFQFGQTSRSDVTVFGDTCTAGSVTMLGKFLELYKNDARAITTGYPSGGDPVYEAIIDTANNQMINVNP